MQRFQDWRSIDLDIVQDIKTLVSQAAERWGDKVGLIIDEFNEKLTFMEIETRSNAIAVILQMLGVEQGDRVAVMLKNRSELPLTWLAIAKIGAAMVPLNINYKEFDARYIIEHSEAKVVVTSQEFIPLIKTTQLAVTTLKTIVCVDEAEDPTVVDLRDLITKVAKQPNPVPVYPETLVNIQYTSGTTGHPKGCMLTHGYWLEIVKQFTKQPPELNENDVMLTAQPFYYMDPQWNLLTAITSGAQLVVLDRFHPSNFWEKIRTYGVTFFYCLGIMPTLMFKIPPSPLDRENQVRYVGCSAIPPHLHREIEERWGAPWYELYGMTEAGGVTSVQPEDHDQLLGTGCIGRIDRSKEARVVDDNGQTLPRRQKGELVLRGRGLMNGYFMNQEATEAAFRAGWFHTGDIVRMEENGHLYFVGRKKEMIRRSGENVSAMEVEEVIKLHPGIQYVACVPVPDDLRGEEVKAYVVLKPGETQHSVSPEELVEFCSKNLAYFKVPRYWEYRPELPCTPSERIAKHLLLKEKTDLRLDSFDSIDKIWRK